MTLQKNKELLARTIIELAARETGVRPRDIACPKHIVAQAFKQLVAERRLFGVTVPGGNITAYFLSRKMANAYFSKVISGEVIVPASFGVGLYLQATKAEEFEQHVYDILTPQDVAGSGQIRSL